MFKRAAAAKAPVQGTPPDQSGAIAASAQPAAQNFYPQSAADRGGSDTKPSGTPEVPIRSPREQEAAAGSPADAERPCEGVRSVPLELARGSQGHECIKHPVQAAPSNPAGRGTSASQPSGPSTDQRAAGCGTADRSDTARHVEPEAEMYNGADVHETAQSQRPGISDPGGATSSEPPHAEMSGGPCQRPRGSESAGPADGGVPAPECDLTSVDVEEQRRIMREIWLRGQGNAGRPGGSDLREAGASTSAATASDRSAKRGRGATAGPGNCVGSAAKEGASKQMRISAMFKAPKKT
jgi:hypothetical protein